jgi:hypothetical protein
MNGSTILRRCILSLCSSAVSFKWQPPIRAGSEPSSFTRTLKAKKGSCRSYDAKFVEIGWTARRVPFGLRDDTFVVVFLVDILPKHQVQRTRGAVGKRDRRRCSSPAFPGHHAHGSQKRSRQANYNQISTMLLHSCTL